eukprot:gene19231-biopygen14548
MWCGNPFLGCLRQVGVGAQPLPFLPVGHRSQAAAPDTPGSPQVLTWLCLPGSQSPLLVSWDPLWKGREPRGRRVFFSAPPEARFSRPFFLAFFCPFG